MTGEKGENAGHPFRATKGSVETGTLADSALLLAWQRPRPCLQHRSLHKVDGDTPVAAEDELVVIEVDDASILANLVQAHDQQRLLRPQYHEGHGKFYALTPDLHWHVDQ